MRSMQLLGEKGPAAIALTRETAMSRYQVLKPSELDAAQRRVWDDVVAGPRGSVPPPAHV